MPKRFIYITLLIITPVMLFPQTSLDSLWKLAKNTSSKKEKIEHYYDFAAELDKKGLKDSALNICDRILIQSSKIDYSVGRSQALGLKGKLLLHQGNYEKGRQLLLKALEIDSGINKPDLLMFHLNTLAIHQAQTGSIKQSEKYFKQVLNLAKSTQDTHRIAGTLNNLALIDKQNTHYTQSSRKYFKIIKYAKALNDKQLLQKAYFNLGSVYLKMENYRKTLDFLDQSYKICKSKNFTQQLPSIYINRALAFKGLGKIDSALLMNKKALEYKDIIASNLLATIHINIGSTYLDMNELDKAEKYIRKGLSFYKSINSSREISASFSNLAKFYIQKDNYERGETYLDSALHFAQKAESLFYQRKVQKLRADVYETQGKYDKALEAFNSYSALTDSLKKEEHLTSISEMEEKMQIERKLQTREVLKKQNALQKLKISEANRKKQIIYIAVVLLIFIILFFIYKFFMDQKKNKKLEQKNQRLSEALEKLNTSRRRNEGLLRAIPDLLFLFDRNGHYLDVKTHNNKKLAATKTELLSSTISDILPRSQSRMYMEAIEKVLANNSLEVFKYNLTIEEVEYTFEARLVAMNTSKVLCIVRDITEESANLEKLEKSKQELKEANIAKDKFFSIIAHDLKNPFNALIGFSSLLNSDYNEFTDEEKREYIKQIYQASDSLFSLLENLLEWTKAQTGKVEFNPQTVNFREIIDNNVDILLPEAQQKNIAIDVEENQAINSTVYGDKNMLTTIIRNLTANAIKFTHPGGQILIKAITNKNMLQCSIIDNGMGMSDEERKILFRIDSKVKKAGTHNEQGTGLGLLLCKEFTEIQNGQIWVDSKKGEGSAFHFTIPISESQD